MPNPRFIQIHTLHSYPAALLNRDEMGSAKRIPYGGALRTRISSQCLKRHWRTADDEHNLHNINGPAQAARSRNIIGREVIQPIRDQKTVEEEVLESVEDALVKGLYGRNAKPGESIEAKRSRQPLILGLPEVEYLRRKAQEVCAAHPSDPENAGKAAAALFRRENQGANFRAMFGLSTWHAGLEPALFGRMVTSDPAANIDAAIHVAHAFTVHGEESENDYFSVVDDLQRDEEEPGAAHINESELSSGLYYGYVVVDLPTLVSNLEGCAEENWDAADRSLAGQVIEHLTHLIAKVSPGAKLGSTAPYTYADLVLVEAGNRQPRTLAGAYRTPVRAQVKESADALTQEMRETDEMYGVQEFRRVSSKREYNIPGAERINLDRLAAWTAGVVRGDAE